MRKKLGVIGVLLLFLVCSMTTAFAGKSDKTTVYKNEEYNFKLSYPKGWVVEEYSEDTIVDFISSDSESEFNTSANVVIDDLTDYPNVTLEEYIDDTIVQLKEEFTDLRLISNEKTLLSGQPARIIIFRGKYEGVAFRWRQAYTLYNDEMYIITFLTEDKKNKEYEEQFEKMIESFRMY